MSLFTRIRSPTSSVFSIDADGILYTWTTYAFTTKVRTAAATMMVSTSRQKCFSLGRLTAVSASSKSPASWPESSTAGSGSGAAGPGTWLRGRGPAACRPRPARDCGAGAWRGGGADDEASLPGSNGSPVACPPGTSAAGLVATLLDARRLPAQVPEVVQLGPAHLAAGDRLDLVNGRAVHREGPLDAHAVADLAYGERLP